MAVETCEVTGRHESGYFITDAYRCPSVGTLWPRTHRLTQHVTILQRLSSSIQSVAKSSVRVCVRAHSRRQPACTSVQATADHRSTLSWCSGMALHCFVGCVPTQHESYSSSPPGGAHMVVNEFTRAFIRLRYMLTAETLYSCVCAK